MRFPASICKNSFKYLVRAQTQTLYSFVEVNTLFSQGQKSYVFSENDRLLHGNQQIIPNMLPFKLPYAAILNGFRNSKTRSLEIYIVTNSILHFFFARFNSYFYVLLSTKMYLSHEIFVYLETVFKLIVYYYFAIF